MAGVPGLGEGVGSHAVGVALGVSFRVRVRVGSLREGSGSRGEPSRDRFRVDGAAWVRGSGCEGRARFLRGLGLGWVEEACVLRRGGGM